MKILSKKDLADSRQVLAYIQIDANAAIETDQMSQKRAFGPYKPRFPEDALKSIIKLASGLEEILK